MAASFKKKYSQHDLRRLMAEQKTKSAPKTNKITINSPLAKYNDLGQLMCVLCKTIVRSEDVWKVHINAKLHKQNVELAKKSVSTMSATSSSNSESQPASTPIKRMGPPQTSDVPSKKPKSILKNSIQMTDPPHNVLDTQSTNPITNETNELPDNFFDKPTRNTGTGSYYEATLTKTSIKTNLVSIKRSSDGDKSDESSVEPTNDEHKDEMLPEGFFDDPIKDAKARNLEYKDPVEEEWEKFQQEIKAASDFSNAIIAEEQEEAITERQIDEIDEQIRNWNRYVLSV